MNENAGQFRSAAFGGFHRQDVLDYIEKITKAHQEEKAALEAALAEAQEERDRQGTKLEELSQRSDRVNDLKEDLVQQIQSLTDRLVEKERELIKAKEQTAALQEKIDLLEPGAESWLRIKDTAGDIEVSAHERAQVTMQEAKAKAAEIRAEAVRWVLDIQAKCDRLQQDLHASVLAAEEEMDQARASFARTEEEIEGFQSALTDLVEGVGENPEE
jgi:chromosome segregation ATPase